MLLPKLNVATGLYVNWDSFVRVDERTLDWIKTSPKRKPSGKTLNTLEEAAYTLSQALEIGGREFLISEPLYHQLRSCIPPTNKRLGGNGYNMGYALYQLALRPLVSYPFRPRSLMVNSPSFKVAQTSSLTSPDLAIREQDQEYDHIVFEFKENPEHGVRAAGRHILSWDLMSFHGFFDEDFLTYATQRQFTDILIFAYAHLLLPEYKERTDVLIDYLDTKRRPKVHFEIGQGADESVFYALNRLADRQCVDSWGLNEKECVSYMEAESESPSDLKKAAWETVNRYGLERICIHTPFFALAVSKFDAGKEAEALRKGCLAAAAKTIGGDLAVNLEIAGRLEAYDLEPAVEKLDGYNFSIVPGYINRNPSVLTGLGDTFAAVQAAVALS